ASEDGRHLIWSFCPMLFHCAGAVRVTLRDQSGGGSRRLCDPALLCSFFTMIPLSRLKIIWTFAPFSDPDSPTQVLLDHGQVIENPSLTGRAGFAGKKSRFWADETYLKTGRPYCMVVNTNQWLYPITSVVLTGDLSGSVQIVNISSGISGLCGPHLQTVPLRFSRSMALVLLWLHRSGQEKKEEEFYNEVRYTPSLIKRSFV
uniref:Uncharacterized protein n=1 Tax=Salmo trutta TaxID=8032 RepID=A0A673WPC4_SALTR